MIADVREDVNGRKKMLHFEHILDISKILIFFCCCSTNLVSFCYLKQLHTNNSENELQ